MKRSFKPPACGGLSRPSSESAGPSPGAASYLPLKTGRRFAERTDALLVIFAVEASASILSSLSRLRISAARSSSRTIALAVCCVNGALLAIRNAYCRVKDSKSARGTTWLTSPMRNASADYIDRNEVNDTPVLDVRLERRARALSGNAEIVKRGFYGCLSLLQQSTCRTETRYLSLPINDTPEQTRRIVLENTEKKTKKAEEFDYSVWHVLQVWLTHANHDVVVPFAGELAENIPVTSTRVRHDFTLILTPLVMQSVKSIVRWTRRVYCRNVGRRRTVRRSIMLVSIGAGVRSPPPRRTVNVVEKLSGPSGEEVDLLLLATEMNVDKSTA